MDKINEKIQIEFNKKFKYSLGRPMEGSLELTHNNVRDFLKEMALFAVQIEREKVKNEVTSLSTDHEINRDGSAGPEMVRLSEVLDLLTKETE